MAHAAVLADRQVFAGSLQFFLALVVALAGFETFGSRLVRSGHGAMALDIGPDFLVAVSALLGVGRRGGQQQASGGTQPSGSRWSDGSWKAP